ncbi:MAG TPA: bifunctional YncE family protein/alkaline phosphatase family protein [Bacteroidales bacterium]|nr:bifunctional YncE family protein/alkaline phosphatase family protein [Bacteroidales bacterium]
MKIRILLPAIFTLLPLISSGQIQLPYNRMIQPAGKQIYFGSEELENHALDAVLSPGGKWLAVEERYSIVFINTSDNTIKYILKLSSDTALKGLMNTYSGITWHVRNGKQEVWWSSASDKSSFVLSASWDEEKAVFGKRFRYKAGSGVRTAIPNELLIDREGSREVLYVVLNGNDKLVKQDIETGDTIWVTDPGVAPYGIVKAAGKLYVTNWAGRHPEPGDKDIAGTPWGIARVDNKNAGGATREGSVAVIDPSTGKVQKEILVGLHPNEIIADKKGKFVYITNSNSDNVSVIRTDRDEVAETISTRMQPEINPFFGDSPDGLALSDDNKNLYVANGMDNSVSVIRLGRKAAPVLCRKNSIIKGSIPVGAYPSAINVLGREYLYVCNLEAEGVRLAMSDPNTVNKVYNAHHMMASVSVIKTPGRKDLKRYTDTVAAVNDLSRAQGALLEPRAGTKPVPVPERIGEPSLFKHVVYIIKENRTYDQILGDMKQGNGDPGLCIFGAEVTPNTHKLAEEFMLLDNFHVSGKCSAEGHQWTDAAIVTDYIEKNVRAWFRSYPHVQEDALVYSPTGFLWDNAMKHGRSVRIYGEASSPEMDRNLTWSDVYRNYRDGVKTEYSNKTTIDPVRKILDPDFPSFGNHKFPDVMRADILIHKIEEYEHMEGDSMPELMVVALPNDHTNGTRPGFPTPRAFVADNDYALGKIVEAFTKSRFWENTVIFVVEDDSQSGWDHVSAYRTVALVISPYSRMRTVNHNYYTQPSMVRTIEQILGLPAMNVQDAIANTMLECFSEKIDLTPYKAVPSNVPFDELNPPLSALSGKALHYAKKSMLPEFDGIDSGNDDLLNRILWFAAKGNNPYPSKYEGKDEEDEDE